MVAPSGNSSAEQQAAMRAVDGALRAGDMAQACRIAVEAVSRGVENAQLLTLAAYGRIGAGDDAIALQYALRAKALSPRSVDVLTVLALCLSRAGRFREAAGIYDAALKQSPGNLQLRFNRACALEDMSEIAGARKEFERVLDAQPNHAEALAHLANLAAQRGDANAARDFGTRALRNDPRQIAAALALAMADIHEKKFDGALAQLTPIMGGIATPINRSIAFGLAGDALDGLNKPSEAFAAYTQSNDLLRSHFKPVYEAPGLETAPARAARLKDYFREAQSENWRADKSANYVSPVETHVFLVGFPRSGTTLLEQVLASHPDIQSMEERDCLSDAADAFIAPPGGLEKLAKLGTGGLEIYRDAYWKRAAEFGVVPSKPVFVDKLPLNSVLLPLVAKLFPRAKILFALRDSRDVVLSCFRRRFGMNAQMYEFLTLSGCAAYYVDVMELSVLYRAKFGLDTHDVRYERIIAAFEEEVRALCLFLNVDWKDEMKAFAARAQRRSIDTPSAAQVARGLYADGAGQWRRYAAELQPAMAVLQPWLMHYGYSE